MPPPDEATAAPPAPASRLWWAVPAVGLVLLALLGMFFGGGPEKVAYGTSYDASGRGFRAAFLLLEGLGFPVERSRRPTGGEVKWVLFPSAAGAKEGRDLGEWVKRGGVVLLAVDDPVLAGHLGLTVEVVEPLGPARLAPGRAGELRSAKAPDITQLAAGPTEVTGPPGGQPWGRLDGRPLVTVYPHGRGQVWLLHRPDVFTNANLREADNAVLACRLAEAMLQTRPEGRLAFDEYCHGLRDRPGVTELVFRPPVLGVTLQVLLLTVLTLWHYGVRFGTLRSVPPPPRRSKEEFLDAMAELLTRKGDRAEAFRTVRDAFLHRLETDLGLPAGTPVESTVHEAARRRGVNPGPLLQLLTSTTPPQGEGIPSFLTALRQLDSAAHECFESRHRPR